MENCYVEDDFLVCFCGKCKPEDCELPSDFTKLSKHMETNDRVETLTTTETIKFVLQKHGHRDIKEGTFILIEKVITTHEREAVAEYKQFVLNVLDGIDIADGQYNTKAIRHALNSRI